MCSERRVSFVFEFAAARRVVATYFNRFAGERRLGTRAVARAMRVLELDRHPYELAHAANAVRWEGVRHLNDDCVSACDATLARLSRLLWTLGVSARGAVGGTPA